MPSKPTASAVGCGPRPGISRPPRPTRLASWVILRGQLAGRRPHLQVPHRRREHRAAEVRPLEQGAEPDAAAHRMRDEVARPGQVELASSVEQRRHVALVVAEVLDVAEHRVAPDAGRDRPWPRQSITDHRQAARDQRARPRGRTSRRTRCGRGRRTAVPRAPPVQTTARSRTPSEAVEPEGPRRPPAPPATSGVEGRAAVMPAGCRASSRAPCRRRPSAGRS